MKKLLSNKALALGAVAVALLASSCTKNFEDVNRNPYGLSNEQLAVDYQNLGEPLKQVQLNIYNGTATWMFQVQQNLNADIFSGYMMSKSDFGATNNHTYNLNAGWNTSPWDFAYSGVMTPATNVLKATTDPKYASYHAWAQILKVEGMHRVTDIFGPIVYSHFGTVNPDGSVSYDAQKDVYYEMFSDLDSAITTLTQLVNDKALATYTKFDLSPYAGSFSQWLKFANTLRLRLALRIVNIDPVKAKTEGEAALANSGGLLLTKDDNLVINIGSTPNPLTVISQSWTDISLGAPIACYLNGYNDPRASKYANKATAPASVAGKIIGIRNGVDVGSAAKYAGYSQLPTYPNTVTLMTASEAWFLKAEAAIRKWANAGDAQTDYETGVQTSFDQNGAGSASAYLADATSTEQPYVDPLSTVPGKNDVPAGSPYLSTITIKWNGGDSFERQLERIITQKWIANYPEGQEAWSEYRRTGYPKLFPVVINASGGAISTALGIRRLPFAQSDAGTNPIGVAAAVSLLGGPDTGGTPLWWDTRK